MASDSEHSKWIIKKLLYRMGVVFFCGGGFILSLVSARHKFRSNSQPIHFVGDVDALDLERAGTPFGRQDFMGRGTFFLVIPPGWDLAIDFKKLDDFMRLVIARDSSSYRYRNHFQLIVWGGKKGFGEQLGSSWLHVRSKNGDRLSLLRILGVFGVKEAIQQPTVFLLDHQGLVLGKAGLDHPEKLAPLLSKVVFESGLHDYLQKHTFFGPKKASS
ncbi:MAG: hypothetical protein OXT67_09040 [Zetaproteobacteria bacterium]|nr:hypothetical protein [Zetaproteobacteria bacterium]